MSYFDAGWMVLPLKPASKLPLLDRWRQYQYPEQRPAREVVEGWWQQQPDANIAILTGRASGLVVIDFDGLIEGSPWAWFRAIGLPEPRNLVRTGGGGLHVYYRHPGFEVHNGVRVAQFGDIKVDVRGDGGYVVAPPSIHGVTGAEYEWLSEDELEPLPQAYLNLMQQKPEPQAPAVASDAPDMENILRGVGKGQRNDAAARVAGYWLRVTSCNPTASWSGLQLWNTQNRPPLPESELKHVFLSIYEREQDKVIEAQETAAEDVLSGEAWADAVRDTPPRVGIQVPSLPTVDEMGGLVPGDLVILAGRPGMGKSTAAWGVGIDAGIQQNVPTLLFSTEMTSADVARWIASKQHGVPVRALSQRQWHDTLRQISQSALMICDKGLIGVKDIVESIRRHKPKIVVIDHIQRLRGDSKENRNQQLEEACSILKGVAKDERCTVLLLSQLNRSSARDGRRPELFDLRDSGGLEQEADGVIFVWTESPDPTLTNLPVKFYLCKNRHGMITEKDYIFDKECKTFEPVDERERFRVAMRQAQTQHDIFDEDQI